MTAGWVAAALRSRAMAAHHPATRLPARGLAEASWPEAARRIAGAYGQTFDREITERQSVHRLISASLLWELRVLAGWVPPRAFEIVRVLAGPFEIDNIVGHARSRPSAVPPYDLGALAIAWPRVRAARGDDIRHVLRASSWGDPGTADPIGLEVGLEIAWARRLRHRVPGARDWAEGHALLVATRERLAFGRQLDPVVATELDHLLGRGWRRATLAELRTGRGGWVLEQVTDPSELWQAERSWWKRVESDAASLVARGGTTAASVVGAVMVQHSAARLLHLVIETAGRGPGAVEVFRAVA